MTLPRSVIALSIGSHGEELKPIRFDMPKVQSKEVIIRVSHCGLCRGDLKVLKAADSISSSTGIPGHEIVGHVVHLGDEVTDLKLNDRVGVGWQSGSCGTCEWCLNDEPELCPSQEETCIGRPGGFATHIKVQARFAVLIPQELNSIRAAALMCGGLAAFTPLSKIRRSENLRIGVVGLGGVGHLALQFSRAFGFHSVLFSGSHSKGNDAIKLGAHEFFVLSELKLSYKLPSPCDLILVTSPGEIDWDFMLSRLLKPNGTICILGGATNDLKISISALIDERKSIMGSPIGSPTTLKQLFDFVLKHEIHAWTEVVEMSRANEAIKELKAGQSRYRKVLRQNLEEGF